MAAASVSSLAGLHVDVAIVGAGINGASAAQHLSADGATSRSSRLLHCGLRHLATGSNIWTTLPRPDRLARAMGIVRTIPHRVKAFNFCLPLYADDPDAPWQLDAAFSILRMMSPNVVPLDYRRYGPNDLGGVPIAPWLRDPAKLRSVAVFREHQFDRAERIALDALFDARRMGAQIHNYTRVEGLERIASKDRWRLSLRAVREIDNRVPETAQVTAGLVLDLAGARADRIVQKAGRATEPKCMGLKGVHIAVRLPEEFADWGLFAYNSLGEPLYRLPWRGMHYIGLTRTPFAGDAAGVVASDEEIDWMIGETNRCLPKLALTRNDVLFT